MDMKDKHCIRRTSSSSSTSKARTADRKTVEKNRREDMKALFTSLNSLLPQQGSASTLTSTSREHRTLTDQIEAATNYIKELETNLEGLKEKKKKKSSLLVQGSPRQNTRAKSEVFESKLAKVEVHGSGDSALEVVLITGLDCYTIFKEAIRVISDQGVEVVNASFSGVDHDSIFHAIHGKIEESAEHQGIVERISERLRHMLLSLDS